MQSVRLGLTAALIGLAGVSCNSNHDDSHSAPRPHSDAAMPAAGVNPAAWQSELHPEMKMVIDELTSLNGKPIESLSAEEARQQPTPADAVMSIMKKKGRVGPEPVGDVADQTIPGVAGQIPVRIYTPKGTGPFPVLVYYHGGGWVIATIDTYDSSARALCNAANVVVVSVEYRKAPENKFPAAVDDAFAAYQWTVQNAASINGKASAMNVAGESAGGNLATEVCIKARDMKIQMPNNQILVYPVAQLASETPSYQKYAAAKPLNKPMMFWFKKQYLANPTSDAENPMASPLKANLIGLPSTTIIGAQIDPLLSDGKMYADALRAAGVNVRYKVYEGVTHEFFGMGAVVPEAKEAMEFAAQGLR